MGVVYKVDTAGRQTVLHGFTGPPDGAYPESGMIRDAAGTLYGTTNAGGTANSGAVYKIDADGKETVLYSFTGGADGANPYAGVIRDAAGNLYGTTTFGANGGVVYKLDPSGSQTVLHTFGGGADGADPYSGVVRDASGNLYGTTQYGGRAGAGIVYKVDATGNETVLFNFPGGPGGGLPYAGVTLDSAGDLYGTALGGLTGRGFIYKLDTQGNESILYSFTGGSDGDYPYAGVIRDTAGNLYGTTLLGGPANAGVVYKIDPAGQETVLHSFAGEADGARPYAGVIRDTSGNLYGTASEGGASNAGLVFKLDSAGRKTNLYSFPAMPDGANPSSALIPGSKGNFYGTTFNGGPANSGVVYKVDITGQETVLYSFAGGAGGANPIGRIVQDADGNIYGTTVLGGIANAGVVYKVDPAGKETVLYAFTGGADGANPQGGVIGDNAGNLYGTTLLGGAAGFGVVFKLDSTLNESVLYSFMGSNDGGFPYAGLVRNSAGALYGTAAIGGTSGDGGVVFEVGPEGGETPLYSFTGGADGGDPEAGVILDEAGNLYGTTYSGGEHFAGVVFKIDTTFHETVLYSFTNGADGGFPLAGLVRDSSGNLYGTTNDGGTGGYWGVVFEVSPTGQETVLYNFTGGADGGQPSTGLFRDSAGNLYGTTYRGGIRATGVVFKIKQ
jgi:uncharacterized repeat protein (TIGR03803 family)